MKVPLFEIYQDVPGEWRWRLVAKNGEIIATGEGYTRKEDANRGIETVIQTVHLAGVVIVEPEPDNG